MSRAKLAKLCSLLGLTRSDIERSGSWVPVQVHPSSISAKEKIFGTPFVLYEAFQGCRMVGSQKFGIVWVVWLFFEGC